MNFQDGELSQEELQYVIGGINRGKAEEVLVKLDKNELKELKKDLQSKEMDDMSLEELSQIQAGTPLSYEDAKQQFEETKNRFGR